jgi:hypothetical protein
MTPGVSCAGDGNSNLYVRVGDTTKSFPARQYAAVPCIAFRGFLFTFNNDMINSATLYKGGSLQGTADGSRR